MLKLKLQYFGHLKRRADSLEMTLMLGKIEGRRRRGQQRMRWLDGLTDSMDMGLGGLGSSWWTGKPGVLQFLGLQRVRHYWVTELKWVWFEIMAYSTLSFLSFFFFFFEDYFDYWQFLIYIYLLGLFVLVHGTRTNSMETNSVENTIGFWIEIALTLYIILIWLFYKC